MSDPVFPGLAAYLGDHMGGPLTIEKISRSEAGLSRQTWFVFTSRGPVLLRIDQPEGTSSVPVTLRFEHDIQALLGETGLPVCRPLWFEDDPAILGQPFYVREFADGSPRIPGFDQPGAEGDRIRIAAAREHARKLAAVHQVDWRGHGFDRLLDAPGGTAQCAPMALARLERQLDVLGMDRWPLLEAGLAFLRDNPPPAPDRVVLCKGSNGMMQEVWRDGEIVALSDWELASIGDPANDWARCQGLMFEVPGQADEDRWGEARLLDYYAELSGLRVTPAALAWYRLFYKLEMIVVAVNSAQVCQVSADARTAWLGTSSLQLLQAGVAEAIGLA